MGGLRIYTVSSRNKLVSYPNRVFSGRGNVFFEIEDFFILDGDYTKFLGGEIIFSIRFVKSRDEAMSFLVDLFTMKAQSKLHGRCRCGRCGRCGAVRRCGRCGRRGRCGRCDASLFVACCADVCVTHYVHVYGVHRPRIRCALRLRLHCVLRPRLRCVLRPRLRCALRIRPRIRIRSRLRDTLAYTYT